MKSNFHIIIRLVFPGIAIYFILVLNGCKTPAQELATSGWQQDFNISERTFVSTGRNSFFILEPGFQLVYESQNEKLVITVLKDTLEVDGIMTRIVEEREWSYNQLIEVSRNFFAICKETKDVFYFGEEVDDYRNGKIIGHGGAWQADKSNNKPGLIMSGAPKVGMKYYQEIAPGIAMDRAEILSLNEKIKTPAGTFSYCLMTLEGSALKVWEKEFKIYANGIGLLKDGNMLLVKYGFTKY